MDKERISELEDWLVEMIHFEEEREKNVSLYLYLKGKPYLSGIP